MGTGLAAFSRFASAPFSPTGEDLDEEGGEGSRLRPDRDSNCGCDQCEAGCELVFSKESIDELFMAKYREKTGWLRKMRGHNYPCEHTR